LSATIYTFPVFVKRFSEFEYELGGATEQARVPGRLGISKTTVNEILKREKGVAV